MGASRSATPETIEPKGMGATKLASMLGKKLAVNVQNTKSQMNLEEVVERINEVAQTVSQIQDDMEVKWEEINEMNFEVEKLRNFKP